MVIAGTDRATRRRAGRRLRDPAFFPFGAKLRRAREDRRLSLDDIGDRTGILPALLERLEDGDLSRFPDERSAVVAVRRYAETLGLDSAFMTQQVDRQWRHVAAGSGVDLAGLVSAARPPAAPEVSALVGAGHTSRYPGDTSHLQAFTQTAQVPRVGTRSVGNPAPRFDTTDAVPVTWRGPHEPPAAPLVLRVAVWATVVLLVLAGAGLSVDHWRPAWLAKINLASKPAGAPARTSHTTTPARGAAVATGLMAPGRATVSVHATAFTVVVATQAPCWIQVTTTPGAVPLFSATVPAGTTKTFASADGQLTVELGASHVLLSARVGGRSVKGWYFGPPSAPYTVNFRSATS
ncbi:MAG TPA: RodZ domain-containing protein [Acidimicrobiales bacterium]|nr:RodZ domain-containing protein [Acidimicrobiales bacterium]